MPVVLLVLAAAVLALDQATKLWVRSSFEVGESVPIWPGVFHLTYVRNTGAAFGILTDQRFLFVAVAAAVTIAILYFGRRVGPGQGWLRFALGLQLGGALGNLVDRLRFGWVVDFLDFRVWPVFNLADVGIVCGSGLLALYFLREERTGGKASPRPSGREG